MKLYGIKTCGSVKKAIKFFKDNGINYEFIDFKTTHVGEKEITKWLKHVDINLLFNSRGTKYRMLKLKDLNLNEEGKKQWLIKENMLIKRPVVEYDGKVLVAFDEEIYKKEFL